MLHDLLDRELPAALEPLAELALDLQHTGSVTAGHIWRPLDPETWDRTENPYLILLNAPRERLEMAAADPEVLRELAAWLARCERQAAEATWFGSSAEHAGLAAVAYFSMEFGLSEALPIYSGGLGILAGDHLRSASDLGVPIVGVGLLYSQGYFRQVLAGDGAQLEAYPYNDPGGMPIRPLRGPDGGWLRVSIELPGRTLLARTWEVRVGRVRLFLLDSNDPRNMPWDRAVTSVLYDAGQERRLLQEILLGVGGWQLLTALGIDAQVCHLNEGHAAFAVLARASAFARVRRVPFAAALRATRAGNVFTTHTPVEAAFDRFDPALVAHYVEPLFTVDGLAIRDLLALGRRHPGDDREPFHMAYLAMRGSARVNGVSRLHGEVSRRLFAPLFPDLPVREVPVTHVTNGVHVGLWDSVAAHRLWSRAPGLEYGWTRRLEEATERVRTASPVELWSFRSEARASLVEYVRPRLARQLRGRGVDGELLARARHVLDPNVLTLGFARRFTEYKRPNLLLHDPERLARILTSVHTPVQLVVAGKAHPNDGMGKSMVQAMARFAARDDVRTHVVFLDDHDMVLAQHLAAGVDVWLNHPRRPAEACGTSGMKMLVNGGLHFSSLDGWWDEAFSPDVGWALGNRMEHGPEGDGADAEQLYDMLEREIVPEFYARDAEGIPLRWVERVRASMTRLTPTYSADRMVREYVEGAYLPAARAATLRAADSAKRSIALESWTRTLDDAWPTARFGERAVASEDDRWHVRLQVYLGELSREWVAVQLYTEAPDFAVHALACERPIPGAVNGFWYAGSVPADRPDAHYTARLVPVHPDSLGPIEHGQILWQR